MAQMTMAIGNPSGATVKCTNKTPTITGKTIKAPNARVLENKISIPPTNSANPARGINQAISINASVSFTKGSGKPSGTGM